MSLPDKIFTPERYTYKDYKLWKGNWELINGYPYAMSPSPNRKHQRFLSEFIAAGVSEIKNNNGNCDCGVYSELDWIINDETVVRPDIMIICGNFETDFLTFPPTLIVEIASPSTRMRDRNAKFVLYEMCGVKYYILADPDKKSIEVYKLTNNKYQQVSENSFQLTSSCIINLDLQALW